MSRPTDAESHAVAMLERGYRLWPRERAVLLCFVDRRLGVNRNPRSWRIWLRGHLPLVTYERVT